MGTGLYRLKHDLTLIFVETSIRNFDMMLLIDKSGNGRDGMMFLQHNEYGILNIRGKMLN